MYHSIIKAIDDKPTANIILNSERQKSTEKRKYWQLEGTAVKGIFERTWSKIKAENR